MAYHRVAGRIGVTNHGMERARRALPLNQYLLMLHNGATTGYLPKFNEQGQPLPRDPNGADDLPNHERLRITEYLVDKIMPNAKYDHEPEANEAEVLNVEDARSLPSDKLRRLLLGSLQEDTDLALAQRDADMVVR